MKFLSNLGSRDLGQVTQEINKLKVVLHYRNPEIISFQVIYGFFIFSIYFYLKFHSKFPNATFNIGKCQKRGTVKGYPVGIRGGGS